MFFVKGVGTKGTAALLRPLASPRHTFKASGFNYRHFSGRVRFLPCSNLRPRIPLASGQFFKRPLHSTSINCQNRKTNDTQHHKPLNPKNGGSKVSGQEKKASEPQSDPASKHPQNVHKSQPEHSPPPPKPQTWARWAALKAFNYFQRFKYFLKRSGRPFNTDDYSAIFSWLVMGNALLIFLGTTTFFSLMLLTFNTVFAQEFVATKMGEFITKNSKLSVTFEKAIVPGWKDGRITFGKVLVSRRPRKVRKFEKRAEKADIDSGADVDEKVDDGNYTQYDLTIEEVSLTLSFNKWVNGHGIIDTLELKGVRGTVDRTHVRWDPNDSATNYKNVYHPGDFDIDNFKIVDLLVTMYQPDGFRPFTMEIYSLNARKLRKHWLFFDMLNADVHGSYDGSLFTIHRRQRELPPEFDADKFYCQTLRINSLSIDHLNRGLTGPFGWITSGKVDMLGELMIPKQPTFLARLRNAAGTDPDTDITQDNMAIGPIKDITLSLQIKLNNVKASVPFQTNDLSYINYALIRPIVGYINSHNTYMEVNNQIVKPLKDFEGSWTIYDCLLMDDISVEVYNNFAEYVADEERRLVRMKRIGFWSGQLLLQLLLLAIGALS